MHGVSRTSRLTLAVLPLFLTAIQPASSAEPVVAFFESGSVSCFDGRTTKLNESTERAISYPALHASATAYCKDKCNKDRSKCGVNQFHTLRKVGDFVSLYTAADVSCHDGTEQSLSRPQGATSEELRREAEQFCKGRGGGGKIGVNSFSPTGVILLRASSFKGANWACHDGTETSRESADCKSHAYWSAAAEENCRTRCGGKDHKCGANFVFMTDGCPDEGVERVSGGAPLVTPAR